MKIVEFEIIKRNFANAGTDEKIRMYVETEDLTNEQYKELLRLYPLNELGKLEAALK